MWETHCDDVVRAALLSYFLIAFALWFATACRGPAEDKTPEPPEKAVVCDLEKARAEMPERERKCNEGDARSCFWLGTVIHGRPWCGTATEKPDRIRAWGLFEKSCLLGDEEGCIGLRNGAGTQWTKKGPPVSELEAACGSGVGYACYLRAQRMMDFWKVLPSHENHVIRHALLRASRDAHPWLERGCAQGIQEACFELALNLQAGSGAAMDPERAVSLLDVACRDWRTRRQPVVGAHLSCIWLGLAYRSGDGIAPDVRRGQALLHEACQLDQVGCEDLFLIHEPEELRWGLWGLESIGALAPGGVAVVVARRRRSGRKWLFPVLLTIATLAGAAIALELWYYFTGSRWQSPLWWAVALVPTVLPVFAWRRLPRGGQ
jgi:hypothetical protein